MLSIPFPRAAHTLNISGYGQVVWYVMGAAYAFSLPYVFSSLLDLGNDFYYAVYFSSIAVFLALYATSTRLDVLALFTRNWRWSLGLGVLAAAFLVAGVLQREDPTPRPDGLDFIFAIAWRGVLYGVVDALILTAFPIAVAYALLSSRLDTVIRRAGFATLALALSLTITATYHVGYEQFREQGVSGPETGNAIISVPAILTTNPLGSVVAHASMHVAAVVHAYETDLYLPPQTLVKAEGEAYPSEVQLADGDNGGSVRLALDGVLIVALPSNPSTGYSWSVEGKLPDALRQQGETRHVPAGSTQPVAGAGGTEVFTFTAAGRDDVTLKLVYKPAGSDAVPERTFSVEVAIR